MPTRFFSLLIPLLLAASGCSSGNDGTPPESSKGNGGTSGSGGGTTDSSGSAGTGGADLGGDAGTSGSGTGGAGGNDRLRGTWGCELDPAPTVTPASTTGYNVLQLGNSYSVTNGAFIDRFAEDAGYREHHHITSWAPGITLGSQWDRLASINKDQPGLMTWWDAVATSTQWDFIILQPYYEPLQGVDVDHPGAREYASNLFQAAQANSPNLRPVIYQIWPRIYGDYRTDDWQLNYVSYYEEIADYVSAHNGNIEVPVSPVGIVIMRLRELLQTEPSAVPGLTLGSVARGDGQTLVTDIYADSGHLGCAGNYAGGVTQFAVLYKRSPVEAGLSALNTDNCQDLPRNLTDAINRIAWEVVTSYSRSGVTGARPEPTGVSIAPAEIELDVDAAQELAIAVSPCSAWDKHVTFASSDPSVATISDVTPSGTVLVKAKAAGTATITATTRTAEKTGTLRVTVLNRATRTNLALGKLVQASTCGPNGTLAACTSSTEYAPSRVTDGDLTSGWWVGPVPCGDDDPPRWAIVDLGTATSVGSTTIHWGTGSDQVVRYVVSVANEQLDGGLDAGWDVVVDRSLGGLYSDHTDFFSTVTARYVRVKILSVIDKAHNVHTPGAREIKAFAPLR